MQNCSHCGLSSIFKGNRPAALLDEMEGLAGPGERPAAAAAVVVVGKSHHGNYCMRQYSSLDAKVPVRTDSRGFIGTRSWGVGVPPCQPIKVEVTALVRAKFHPIANAGTCRKVN